MSYSSHAAGLCAEDPICLDCRFDWAEAELARLRVGLCQALETLSADPGLTLPPEALRAQQAGLAALRRRNSRPLGPKYPDKVRSLK